VRTLITGGAGFIGSHLCERFLAEGHNVLCVDNFITGRPDNIRHLLDNPKFRVIVHDVSEPLFVDGLVDNVLHFASPASPVDYQDSPIQTLKVGSLGTHVTLGIAKAHRARYLIASTSEVYGDPEVHPQTEDYWGRVNPVGERSMYDEAKRFAEAMTMGYHREHGVETHIVRIFNSILADQVIVACDDDGIFIGPVGEYADRIRGDHQTRTVRVPAFAPDTRRMELRPALALTEHKPRADAFELTLRYGRSLKVTGDHSVFVPGPDGQPTPKPARDIRPGDAVAIPARLPVTERDRPELDVGAEFVARQVDDPWDWAVQHPDLTRQVTERRAEVNTLLAATGRYTPTRSLSAAVGVISRKYIRRGRVPLPVVRELGLAVPDGAEILPHGSSDRGIRNRIRLTDDVLWLCGFYLAEGAEHSGDKSHFISLCSNEEYLRRARAILEQAFGVATGYVPPGPGRGPSVYAHSKVLHRVFRDLLGLRDRRIPGWVMQLPLSRVKHFLEGFRCGDGTHSGKKVGNELCFDTTSEWLATDLNYLLLRFGIVASFGRYETTFRQKYGDRRFPFYRLTVCELDTFDVLSWDRGVAQTLNARRTGDLVWARVKEVRPCLLSPRVYDFSVPGHENFVAGNGVCSHNTYGERMRLDDGRVLPNFVGQALRGEPLTIYGDGKQTRSFCYVSDLVDGIYRLLHADYHLPVNIGNPSEITIREFAEEILKLTGAKSPLVNKPLPADDPKQRKPDISLARKLLGWEPKVGREEGLRRTIEYFKRQVRA